MVAVGWDGRRPSKFQNTISKLVDFDFLYNNHTCCPSILELIMVILSKLASSSTVDLHRYDVFLSFRGADTRHSFIAYLRKALTEANINIFLHDEEIETGEDLNPEMESAIKASKASIVVLSKNYAASTRCLDELVLILDQRIRSNHIVIPIFYHVEPTAFGFAIAEHKKRIEAATSAIKRSQLAAKIDRWQKALTEIANFKGNDVKDRLETEFIEELVMHIYHRLRPSSRSAPPLLIGMEDSMKFVTSWLNDASSHTSDVLTIFSMGGIGKTSLARYVYELHFNKFDASSFIEDISRRCDEKLDTCIFIKDMSPRCEDFDWLLDLQKQLSDDASLCNSMTENALAFNRLFDVQKQLYYDITKPSSVQVHDVSRYTSYKKVLIVLDDIDSHGQLDALLGNKGFHPGSKIIITTNDAGLTEHWALFKKSVNPKHVKHMLQGLDENGSQKLLCYHAFRCNDPKAGYEEVSKKLTRYCEGHPLALEVLGKSLHDRDVSYWDECIQGLKKELDFGINNVLRKNVDSLPSENDKKLFKHISCFFVGMDRDFTVTVLKACGVDTRSGITNLINRCLLGIGPNNELKMHKLVQEMGRFLVRQESPAKPWKRSRLWCHEESFKMLKQKKGTGNVLGLTLDMKMLENEKLHKTFELETNALSKMDNLMLLQLNHVQTNGSYKNFPEKLRWLCMHGFPLKSIPSDLPMENLVALDMSYSNVESIIFCYSNQQLPQKKQKLTDSCSKDKKLLGSLKILNLSFCDQLGSLGGFEELPALERLIVRNCIGLVEVCESIDQCVELVLVDLSYCDKLENLPTTIRMFKNVKLLLDGCNLGKSQVEIGDNESTSRSLEMLDNSVILRNVKFITHYFSRSLVRLSLANSNLFIESFPIDFSCLSMLKALYLDENPIVSMPNCVRSLPRLKILSMANCRMLTSVQHPPHTLRSLMLDSDHKPLQQKVVFDQKMSLHQLSIWSNTLAASSFEIEGMMKIQSMAGVEENVLRSLGWTKLDFLNKRHVETSLRSRRLESEIQMYYEFGIFSTFCRGEKMPNWIRHRSMGPSISVTIPSSTNNFRGLNFCFVQAFPSNYIHVYSPMIIMYNRTRNRTWIYNSRINKVNVGNKERVILLSHWMFGMNEMEAGDQVTITGPAGLTNECGVSFVYDDEEEQDVLSYYKSWNHIIGGDLNGFQLTTGEYILDTGRFTSHGIEVDRSYFNLVGHSANYKEKQVYFRALSQRKSGIIGHTPQQGRAILTVPLLLDNPASATAPQDLTIRSRSYDLDLAKPITILPRIPILTNLQQINIELDELATPSYLVVALAVNGSRKTKYIVKWALDKFVPEGMLLFKLFFVRPKITMIHTPLGPLRVTQVREDIVNTYKNEIERRSYEKLLPFKNMCAERKVQVEIVQIESDDVVDAIKQEVMKNNINKLVIGASSSDMFSKRRNLSSRISESIPSFCTVYVISKRKLSFLRASDSKTIVSSKDDHSVTSSSQTGTFDLRGQQDSSSIPSSETIRMLYSKS